MDKIEQYFHTLTYLLLIFCEQWKKFALTYQKVHVEFVWYAGVCVQPNNDDFFISFVNFYIQTTNAMAVAMAISCTKYVSTKRCGWEAHWKFLFTT